VRARAERPGTERIEQLAISAFAIPTDAPEADGTYDWRRTVLVTVEATSEGVKGLGYTYADQATAKLIETVLANVVLGRDAMAVRANYDDMVHAVRNLGRDGVGAMAISAVDAALWDLKARLLDRSMVDLLGAVRDEVPIYGSGGFTSYEVDRLEAQLQRWIEQGIPRVKMKIGARADEDVQRVRAARSAIGAKAELFVDANGAYSRKQAVAQAERFAELDVRWFEEPVSSDDLAGLKLLVDRAPATMEIAAGEYGYEPRYFERMIGAGAVDIVQADATRCGGVTGFMMVAALCDAHGLPLSSHCAPSLHVHLGCAASRVRHLEYFYDHVRIENLLFDGVVQPVDGALAPDRGRLGFGLELRHHEAERFVLASTIQRKE
jgi:L-alanine-DL-glutamate epimerase-like enolase superfamily enzyme